MAEFENQNTAELISGVKSKPLEQVRAVVNEAVADANLKMSRDLGRMANIRESLESQDDKEESYGGLSDGIAVAEASAEAEQPAASPLMSNLMSRLDNEPEQDEPEDEPEFC